MKPYGLLSVCAVGFSPFISMAIMPFSHGGKIKPCTHLKLHLSSLVIILILLIFYFIIPIFSN
jgi:hypothetical protein